ncbi:MAG: hypothetical protein FD123_3003 [Bacteroidetes bacterium]|nr:MAG: hypothetical protein FD123_3003 [Bacteroidota bacterium]
MQRESRPQVSFEEEEDFEIQNKFAEESLTTEPAETIVPNFLGATDIVANKNLYVQRYPGLRLASLTELQGGNREFVLEQGDFHKSIDGEMYYMPDDKTAPSLLLYDSNLIDSSYDGKARGGYWSVPGYQTNQRFVFSERINSINSMSSARGNARRPVMDAITTGGGAVVAAAFGSISVEVIGNNANPDTLTAVNDIAASLRTLYPAIMVVPVLLTPAQIEENNGRFPADRINTLLKNADKTINILTSVTYSGWVFR